MSSTKRIQFILSLLRLSELKKHVKNLPPYRVRVNFHSLDSISNAREERFEKAFEYRLSRIVFRGGVGGDLLLDFR